MSSVESDSESGTLPSSSTSTAAAPEASSAATKQPAAGPIFKDINADDEEQETTVIESACMNCFKIGATRLLLTKIPFYREVVIMSFKCDHCGYENNEIQSASKIQKKGISIVLNVESKKDLNRRVVRSDYTSVVIPEVELEIPWRSQKGEITTVEGIIDRTIRGLTQDQEKRRIEHPDIAATIDAYIVRLNDLKDFKIPFTLKLEDISGNSFVENPLAPTTDPNCKVTHFTRTKQQDRGLGLYEPEDIPSAGADAAEAAAAAAAAAKENDDKHLLKPIGEGDWPLENLHGEVLQFHTNCPNCLSPCETNMKLTNIPHFKEVVIMATVCDICGAKTNEVKSGGGIEEKGTRFQLRIESKEDLTRDVLKSETCSLSITELQLEVGPSAINGRFTTVEGILVAMKEQLVGSGIFFFDSSDENTKYRLDEFVKTFDKILNLEKVITLTLDDPAGNSYVQSLSDDDTPDGKLKIETYERSYSQNEELGLNDIKTENYQ